MYVCMNPALLSGRGPLPEAHSQTAGDLMIRPTDLADRTDRLTALFRPPVTGAVSYSVGGAAAPPTFASATPTLWLATPILMDFGDIRLHKGHVDPELYHGIIFLSFPTLKRLIFTMRALNSSSNITVCPTNFAKEAPPMPPMLTVDGSERTLSTVQTCMFIVCWSAGAHNSASTSTKLD